MAKIRGIKPTTWTDDKFASRSPLARLLFMGMWTEACDNGHVEDNLVQLKIRLLPMDACDIADLVRELLDSGQVVRGAGYLKVVNLAEHQKRPDPRFLTLCPHCLNDPDVRYTDADKFNTAGKASPKKGNTAGKASPDKGNTAGDPTPDPTHTPGTRRAHGENTPSGPHPHAGDVDGDGDGEEKKPPSSAMPPTVVARRATEIDEHPSPEVVALCEHLAERVTANGHNATIGKGWYRACRLLLDVDRHTPDQVRAAIDWATADPFWSANIRSMQTLREKYSTLRARAQAARPQAPTTSRHQQETESIFANAAVRFGVLPDQLAIGGAPA